jgi:hypothetical protein
MAAIRSKLSASERPDQAMARIPATTARRLVVALPPLLLAACAPNPAPETTQAAIAPSRADVKQSAVCRPDPSLLVPQSPPDCVFGRPDLKTLDPDQWARLKLEYERQCYQRAERNVRERLRLLQAASRCEAMARADNSQ